MMYVKPSRCCISRAAALSTVFATVCLITPRPAEAQNAILAEMYGRGVHAYYSGSHTDAYNLLSMAIHNGSQDPRAYYFRGIVAEAQGRAYEAESDWRRGAELEAAGGQNPAVGRSLARFQGSSRLKLEQIRQRARLDALALAAARSQARYGEIKAAQPTPTMPPAAPSVTAPPSSVTPPPTPDMGGNPFAGDSGTVASGEPKVESDDALDGVMDPLAGGDSAAGDGAGAATASSDPFATPADGGGAAAADDPFATPAGGGSAPADDPFATPAADDPFAPSGDGGAMDDPFATDGDDPFAN